MKKFLIYIFTIIILSQANNLFAQQDLMTNNKINNQSIINPAYKSFHDRGTLIFHHRSQWVGFNGAPVTDMVLFNSKTVYDNMVMGGAIINDNIGPTNNLNLRFNYNYAIEITRKSEIVFGANAGFNIISNKFSNIALTDPNDAAFAYDNNSVFTPNIGLGVFYHTYQFYAGISVPSIIQSKPKDGFVNLKRHYYIISGANLRINKRDKYMFQPKLLIKMVPGAPIQYDLNLDFLLSYNYILGIAYRSGDIIGINLGMDIVENLTLLYSFGYSFSNTSFKYNGGSHEVMLRYLMTKFKKINITKRRHRIGKGNRI